MPLVQATRDIELHPRCLCSSASILRSDHGISHDVTSIFGFWILVRCNPTRLPGAMHSLQRDEMPRVAEIALLPLRTRTHHSQRYVNQSLEILTNAFPFAAQNQRRAQSYLASIDLARRPWRLASLPSVAVVKPTNTNSGIGRAQPHAASSMKSLLELLRSLCYPSC